MIVWRLFLSTAVVIVCLHLATSPTLWLAGWLALSLLSVILGTYILRVPSSEQLQVSSWGLRVFIGALFHWARTRLVPETAA